MNDGVISQIVQTNAKLADRIMELFNQATEPKPHPWDVPMSPTPDNPLGWTARQIIENYRSTPSGASGVGMPDAPQASPMDELTFVRNENRRMSDELDHARSRLRQTQRIVTILRACLGSLDE